MTFYTTIILAFLLGLVASFYGSIAGGASFLSLPGLIFLGIPPEVAVATNNLANLGRFSLSSVKFIRSKKIIWKYVYTLAPLGLLAGFLGARILLEIDRDLVRQSLGIVMLCLVPLGFTKKEFGTVAQAVSQRRFLIGHFVYFAVSIYGAALQIGSGPLVLYLVIYFFGLTILQANATSSFCWLFITISALATFIANDAIHWPVGIAMLVGSSIGGYAGTHVAVSKGDLWTKRFFAIVISIMAIRLLFFA